MPTSCLKNGPCLKKRTVFKKCGLLIFKKCGPCLKNTDFVIYVTFIFDFEKIKKNNGNTLIRRNISGANVVLVVFRKKILKNT